MSQEFDVIDEFPRLSAEERISILDNNLAELQKKYNELQRENENLNSLLHATSKRLELEKQKIDTLADFTRKVIRGH